MVRKNKLAARFLRRSPSRESEDGEGAEGQRGKGTEAQRHKGAEGQRDKEAEGQSKAESRKPKTESKNSQLSSLDPQPSTLNPAADRRSSIVYQELVPSYTVMFVFFLVNIMARSFIHERELGTLRRLRIAPIAAVSVLIGKTLPFFIISLAQTGLLFLSGRVLFGMSWGTLPFLLLPVIACTSLAATGLGLLVATLARTDSQVSAYGNFVVITMAGISGCFMPRDWLPTLMQKISLATPHSWALIAYDQLLSASVPAVATVALSCCVLVAFALLFFLLGCLRFRRYA